MASRKKKRVVVAVSGGFDPIHPGHARLFKEARQLGTELVVILNNDNWLMAKKGFVFMSEGERKELLEALGPVDRVVISRHKPFDSDRSVSQELASIRPHIFANGGDRNEQDATNPSSSLFRDMHTCAQYGIRLVFNVGAGGKIQSSSWLTERVAGKRESRPWGIMHTHVLAPQYWVKTITVAPGKRLSLQSHKSRAETWVCVAGTVQVEIGRLRRSLKPGEYVAVPKRTKHRLSSKKGGVIVEVAYGSAVREDDIIRYEDDFGRAPASL